MEINIFDTTIILEPEVIDESPSTIHSQLREYSLGERHEFSLEINYPLGFTGEVMAEKNEIPYGETRTYGELAAILNTSPIAVGQACANNPIPVVIPCHRVVGRNGSLKGYGAGDGVSTKQQLLDLEQKHRLEKLA